MRMRDRVRLKLCISLTSLRVCLPGLSSGVRDSEGREFAEARRLDPGEVPGRREFPALAVLRTERRGMLVEIFGAAGRGQTRLYRRRRGHMHQSVLQTNPHGERRGKRRVLFFPSRESSKKMRSTKTRGWLRSAFTRDSYRPLRPLRLKDINVP